MLDNRDDGHLGSSYILILILYALFYGVFSINNI
jgi:hypothetical protein